ncbi:diguanylate cyclase [Phosphitispora sp. TUW77]|uniref:diguanylate cyclase n=1 Tax=Phosphitispora sp. TUW77 TaxID=3152361 RepID=UPI003AB5B696
MALKKTRQSLLNLINRVEVRYSIGLRTKMFIPFFIATFCAIAAISYYSMNLIGSKIEAMQQQKVNDVLTGTVENLKNETFNLEAYARLLADSPELEKAVTRKDKKMLYELLVPVKYYSGLHKIQIFNSNKEIIVELSSRVLEANPAETRLVQRAIEGVTRSDFSVTNNGFEIFAATPINFDPTRYGVPIGALIVDRHYGDLELSQIKDRSDVEINVFHAGKLVASTLNQDTRAEIIPQLLASMEDNSYRVLVSQDQNEYLNAWQAIGDDGIISVMVPNDYLVAAMAELSKDIITITVVAAALIFLSSFLLAELILRPLTNMLKVTTAITNGDLSKRIKIFTGDELGQLAKAINFMADKIKVRLDEAEMLATVDGLTGLYNYRYFQQRLREELNRAERLNSPISLVMLDIDYFKKYNDTHGHPAGDKVIHTIGEIIKNNIRSVDIAARYGGEEFAIILVDTVPDQAYYVSERIRQEVAGHLFAGRETQPGGILSISGGIASAPFPATKQDELIKMADDALYKAKRTNRNKVVVYYSGLDELKLVVNEADHGRINTINTFISIINLKDRYTYGHSERVAQYAFLIAKAMNLDEALLKKIKLAAYLHDIGKIELDRELLNKAGELSLEEIEILHRHPEVGADILKSVKSLSDIAPLVLHHHEKFNGKGYPAGLSGEAIPLPARIIKLADSFDAMTSVRPYQKRKSFQQAKEELVKYSGIDFDPVVVEAFLQVLDKTNFNLTKMVS